MKKNITVWFIPMIVLIVCCMFHAFAQLHASDTSDESESLIAMVDREMAEGEYLNCSPSTIELGDVVYPGVSLTGVIRNVARWAGTPDEKFYTILQADTNEQLVIAIPQEYEKAPVEYRKLIGEKVAVKGFYVKDTELTKSALYTKGDRIEFIVTEIDGYNKQCCNKRLSLSSLYEVEQFLKGKRKEKITDDEMRKAEKILERGYVEYKDCLWLKNE